MCKRKHSSDTIGALAVALGVESDAWHHHHGETDMEVWQMRVSVSRRIEFGVPGLEMVCTAQ
jgi:hypothetical protein